MHKTTSVIEDYKIIMLIGLYNYWEGILALSMGDYAITVDITMGGIYWSYRLENKIENSGYY